jgi:transcriptional regulator with XRE-family HTH domain
MMESDFVDRLRAALDDAGITQSRLAGELGVRAATVSDWLTRKSIPGGEVMMRLPEILQVDGHWLLTGHGSPVLREADAEELMQSGERQRLATLLALALEIVEPQRVSEEEEVWVTRVRKAGGGVEQVQSSRRRKA